MKQTLRDTKMHRQTAQPQPHALTQLVEANTQQQPTVHTAMLKHNGSCDSDNPLIGRLFYHVTRSQIPADVQFPVLQAAVHDLYVVYCMRRQVLHAELLMTLAGCSDRTTSSAEGSTTVA